MPFFIEAAAAAAAAADDIGDDDSHAANDSRNKTTKYIAMTDTMSKIFKYNCKRFFVHCIVGINIILCCDDFHPVEMRTDARLHGLVYSLFGRPLMLLSIFQCIFTPKKVYL